MASVALSTKAVGSTVKLKVNGTAREFLVVHQGKPSSLYDESCNGTWLLMKDCYESLSVAQLQQQQLQGVHHPHIPERQPS